MSNGIRKKLRKLISILTTTTLLLFYQNCGELHTADDYSSNSYNFSTLNSSTTCSTPNVLAFPGAVGYGKNTIGGRGGRVVHVTNTNNSGQGSLRWALEDISEPRIVVFDVEGRIRLNDEIQISSPYVTIAGQTAPGEGVVISGGRIHVRSKEVIIRGLTSRPGDEDGGDIGRNRDSVSIGGNGIKGVENVVVDHNSFSWAVDETLTVWGEVKNITLSNNILAEALYDSIHIHETRTTRAPHSMGLLIGHSNTDKDSVGISVTRNFFASNNGRNPFFKGVVKVDFVNNYISNYGMAHQAVNLGGGLGLVEGSFISNYFENGKDTGSDSRPAFDLRSLNPGSKLFFDQNYVNVNGDASDPISDKAHGRLQYIVNSAPYSISVPVVSTDTVKDLVMENAGARKLNGDRDVVDARILREVRNGTTRIIDSQREVGGYNVYDFGSATVKDSDGDGIPDDFERINASFGFNPNVADDKNDSDNDGYTNIEEYINGLVSGFELGGCNSGGGDGGTDPGNDQVGSFSVEAESLELEGFNIKANPSASNNAWIEVQGEAKASFNFNGETGTYNIEISYFDENDGESNMSVLVDSVVIDSFAWDEDLGSNLANSQTLTKRIIENVVIENGQLFSLEGESNASEPLRTDKIDFVLQESEEDKPVRLELENLALNGFTVNQQSVASGGAWVEAKDGEASVSFDFEAESGDYDITVGYFDENDGVSTMNLSVNGQVVSTWAWDEDLGSRLANNDTKTTKVISGVSLREGDVVELSGLNDGGEPLRTDYIEYLKSPLVALKYEAEDLNLINFVVKAQSGASGDAWIETRILDSEASLNFDGASGNYDIVVHYYDENDGESTLAVSLNNSVVESWVLDQVLGSHIANNDTKTSHTIENVSIQQGDLIKLLGQFDDQEQLRTDYIEFIPAQ